MPQFLEALLLHHLDNLDSKMETMRAAAERDKLVEGEFTSWVGSLERAVLKKDKFLASENPPAMAQVPSAPTAALADEWKQADSEREAPVRTEPNPVVPQAALTSAERPDAAKQSAKPEKVSDFGSKLQAVLDLKR